MRTPPTHPGSLLALLALACGGREAESTGGENAAAPAAAVRIAPAAPDACGWSAPGEVAAILGALEGKPDDTAAAADTLEGPWEEAAANGTTGQLYFLKNDRMLEIGYLTSSTDRAGAVRLARAAVGKL